MRMTEEETIPVKTRFGVAVYFTIAVWSWWLHGKEFDIRLELKRR